MGQHVTVTEPIDQWFLATTCLVSSSFPCLGRRGSQTVYGNNTKDRSVTMRRKLKDVILCSYVIFAEMRREDLK